ncbi:MAG: 30S ribosomal protein S12 methylthiotransferase RimO [Clostridia bacterium]|nr:30S ribosomal protein S12 methylthiotransferase RimO [Clostridia bacterium]
MKVGFISLGCSKNLIDTEVTIGMFKNNNYEIVNKPENADILVINTCGFIETAKEEAINTILEMAEYKNKKCKYLIVMGCLVQRYYEDLIKLLPEVDLFIKIDEYDKLWYKIEDLLKRDIVEKSKTNTIKKISEMKPLPMPKYEEFMKRVVTTGKNYAYIKIGEGCSNRCTYCAIPYIRGTFVSRKIEDILNEAEMLAKKGIKELIVIAQDTTKYGIDIYGESKLAELLEKLSKIKGIEWIRFLYSYPEGITEELIKTVANNKKIAKYFDIPIQHISNSILKKMNRKTSKENIIKLIKNIKEQIPNVTLRTSLIVGFPGETKENFEELLDFVKTTKFDKLGTFMYSKEEGTPAAKLPEQIHGNTKKARYNKIMEAQQKISKEILKDKIDNIYKVLIEDMSFDGKYFIGRTMQDVPEEDGLVYIKNDGKIDKKEVINSFVNCKIENVNNYDLIGKIDKRGR